MIDTLPVYMRKRYFVVFLAFLGTCNLYTMRVNLSVAIVAMTEIRIVSGPDGITTIEQDLQCSSAERGFALGAFFYGYITTMFLGGFIASKFGGKWVSRFFIKSLSIH